MENFIQCIMTGPTTIECNGTEYDLKEAKLNASDSLFWVYLGIYVALVLFAGLMAGLTIAILSLDMTSLKVAQAAGSESTRKYAKRLIPMVKRRHLLLVTLVLANAASVEAMPIFMDRISDPITAIIVSATAVLIFGEVIPQAVCSRYGLKVGYFMSWLVWGLVGLLFIIAFPFSILLDKILGKESGTHYGRKELEALVDIHGPQEIALNPYKRKGFTSALPNPPVTPVGVQEERLTIDEVLIIKGALSMTNKIASTAMVKLQDVFMLSICTVFDEPVLKMIFELGHSRIPVYEGNRQNIIGVFLTKRLIAIDSNEGITLRQLIYESSTADRKAFYQGLCVDENMHMYELLNRFQTGTMSHMAFVTSTKEPIEGDMARDEIIGIVTLEDVIEELLQEEIFDEADIKRDWCECTVAKTVQKMALDYRQKALIPHKIHVTLDTKVKSGRNDVSSSMVNIVGKKTDVSLNGLYDKNNLSASYTNPQLQLVEEFGEGDIFSSNYKNDDWSLKTVHSDLQSLSAVNLNENVQNSQIEKSNIEKF